jgi:hypothetical protein
MKGFMQATQFLGHTSVLSLVFWHPAEQNFERFCGRGASQHEQNLPGRIDGARSAGRGFPGFSR